MSLPRHHGLGMANLAAWAWALSLEVPVAGLGGRPLHETAAETCRRRTSFIRSSVGLRTDVNLAALIEVAQDVLDISAARCLDTSTSPDPFHTRGRAISWRVGR